VIRVACGGSEFIRKEDLFPHLDEFARNTAGYIGANGLGYQLVHAHYWDAGYAGMNIAGELGVPFIFTAHSLGAWKKEQMGGDPEEMERLFKFSQRIRWENVIFRRARAQTVTTLDGKETYKRLYGFESDDLVVIPPGVDVRRFRPDPTAPSPPLRAPGEFVFALSRIDSNKGLDYLIRAFERVRRQSGAHLVIGGGSKNPKAHEIDVKGSLLALVDALSLRDRVTFTGYVPDADLDTYYRRARVFVLPSKYEPFGMTVLEAMACGTPVVATRHGGLRHVLTHGEDSLLVDPSDPEELSAAVLDVLKDEALARRLGEAGLRLVRDRFSWQSIARQTLSFYERYAPARPESF
jgi:mannosylfructose-phosphate synthase